MTFWCYILHCRDGTFYTGHTDNLETRIGQHHSGLIKGHTQNRRPLKLVWSEGFPTRLEALEAEKRIKGWSRAKKQALIADDWDRVSLLARNRQGAGDPSTSSGPTDLDEQPQSQHPVRAEPVEVRSELTTNTPVGKSGTRHRQDRDKRKLTP